VWIFNKRSYLFWQEFLRTIRDKYTNR